MGRAKWEVLGRLGQEDVGRNGQVRKALCQHQGERIVLIGRRRFPSQSQSGCPSFFPFFPSPFFFRPCHHLSEDYVILPDSHFPRFLWESFSRVAGLGASVLCFPLVGEDAALRDVDRLANPSVRVADEVNLTRHAARTRREHSVKDALRDDGKRGVGQADVGGAEARGFTNACASYAVAINMNQGTTDVDEGGVAWVPRVWGEVVLDSVG